jgi:NAD(P)-binding Rossmann-like domain
MNRRNFLVLSGASLATSLLSYYSSERWLKNSSRVSDFSLVDPSVPIEVIDNPTFAHKIRENFSIPSSSVRTLKTDTLIIGSGIAGISAAAQLPHQDWILSDLMDRLSGSAASYKLENFKFATGAHYTLEFPNNFGLETLKFLENKEIIRFNNLTSKWDFIDSQYLVPENNIQEILFQKHRYRDFPFSEKDLKRLLDLVEPFLGKMSLPTRLLSKNIQSLDKISFKNFLSQKSILLSDETIDFMNYRMQDDYGGDIGSVSALAALTHYAGRPNNAHGFKTFSAPQGNDYFGQKIASKFSTDQLLLNSAALHILETPIGFETFFIQKTSNEIIKVVSRRLLYAGQKFGLKYIFPKYYPPFSKIRYSPWLTVGILLKKNLSNPRSFFWQNEIIGTNQNFLGFVNSQAQNFGQISNSSDYFSITAYYSFKPEDRSVVRKMLEDPYALVNKTASFISQHLDYNISQDIKRCFIKAHGHGIPIPSPGHMDIRKTIHSSKKLAFAGADYGRLPLLFDVIDSGLQAANDLSRN